MREVNMWCPQCELWTKEYNRSGFHDCGTEVISSGYGELELDDSVSLGLTIEPNKVICRVSTMPKVLVLNKEYDVISETGGGYIIKDELGNIDSYMKYLFDPVDKYGI